MRIILLSGGSGKRLWPLSNDYRSKQFIKVAGSGANQSEESMIQRVWYNLQKSSLDSLAVIAASKVQEEVIQSQLGEQVPLVLEPVKRDTFPAIGLTSAYLNSECKVDENEVIVVIPVDVEADASFYESIRELALTFRLSTANIGLIGLRPTHPSEKFGYIVTEPAPDNTLLLRVDRFVEKPNKAAAAELIDSGALWNCGVFVFRLGYMLKLLQAEGWPLQYDELLQRYHLMPAISFDYKVVEKEDKVVVRPFAGKWNDLGTWDEWTASMPHLINGKGVLGSGCSNTHIVNELPIPIAVLGISNAVIAASPDGILVADKKLSPALKELIQPFSERPMYEETLYGWYRVIDIGSNTDNQQYVTKRVHVWENKHISYQVHASRDEIWTVINGRAEVVIDGERSMIFSGDVVHIPSGSLHAIRAITKLDLIEVQIGECVSEDDIVRYNYEWRLEDQEDVAEASALE